MKRLLRVLAIPFFVLHGIGNLLLASGPDRRVESLTYLRPSGDTFVTEFTIEIRDTSAGRTITSTTQRGDQVLTLIADFNSDEELRTATVRVRSGKGEKAAQVEVRDGKARVSRAGSAVIELNCPPGVIVTSAPDWTDSVLAVRRIPRAAGEALEASKRTFRGLWVHPAQEPLELHFPWTPVGSDIVLFRGSMQRLDRFLLMLRGGTRYVVWRGPDGNLVRLVPENSPRGGIVLRGWETATRDLKLETDRD